MCESVTITPPFRHVPFDPWCLATHRNSGIVVHKHSTVHVTTSNHLEVVTGDVRVLRKHTNEGAWLRSNTSNAQNACGDRHIAKKDKRGCMVALEKKEKHYDDKYKKMTSRRVRQECVEVDRN